MYYIVYRTTNKINGKFYVGVHKTNNLEDDYLGSGKILIYARAKYGDNNFKKETLFVYDNPDDMFLKEAEIVDKDFIARDDTYNIKVGGEGGWDHINSGISDGTINRTITKVSRTEAIRRLKLGTLKHQKMLHDDNYREWWLERTKQGMSKVPPPFLGKTHTVESKAKIGVANSKHQMGKGNSQYGSFWITDGIENKKLSKGSEIPEGWKKGRKIKSLAC